MTSLTVFDNGIGIPAQDIPRVFDKAFTGKTAANMPNQPALDCIWFISCVPRWDFPCPYRLRWVWELRLPLRLARAWQIFSHAKWLFPKAHPSGDRIL